MHSTDSINCTVYTSMGEVHSSAARDGGTNLSNHPHHLQQYKCRVYFDPGSGSRNGGSRSGGSRSGLRRSWDKRIGRMPTIVLVLVVGVVAPSPMSAWLITKAEPGLL